MNTTRPGWREHRCDGAAWEPVVIEIPVLSYLTRAALALGAVWAIWIAMP